MTRGGVFRGLRAIATGWVTLGLLVFLVERPLLRLTGPALGGQWIATAQLGLDCVVLVGTGWVVGRMSRPSPMLGVLVFAATLMVWDISFLVAINVPWLMRLAVHTLSDGSFLSSLVSTAASQALLFGSLLGGGLLSRAREKPVSIVA